MQFRVIVLTDPQTNKQTNKQPQTHKQTGPITIHCAAASAQCNNDIRSDAYVEFSSRVSTLCMQSAILFYQFRPSVSPSAKRWNFVLNERTYRKAFSNICQGHSSSF